MNAAVRAYQSVARTGYSTRQLEAEVLLHCARTLQAAIEDADPELPGLIPALERNRRLWQLFSVHLRREDSDLTPEMRQSMGVQAAGVFALTGDVCAALADAKPVPRDLVATLIEVNRILAEGLSAKPE